MSKAKKVYHPIKLPDYRVIRPMAFLEESGDYVATFQQLSSFTINDCKVSFITPNSITMFYNKSWKEYEIGKKIYNDIIKSNLQANTTYDVKEAELSMLYDYFEHIQTSIITIYSAIEALCNVAIPLGYTLTKKNNKGVTEIWDKASIEKWISTEEKVGKIIPEILKIESPKTLPLWKHFKDLKEIRDNIIHQKQSVKQPNEVESKFLCTLLDHSVFIKILSGFELIQYFCKKDETHTYFPIIGDETPMRVDIVEKISGTFSFVDDASKKAVINFFNEDKKS